MSDPISRFPLKAFHFRDPSDLDAKDTKVRKTEQSLIRPEFFPVPLPSMDLAKLSSRVVHQGPPPAPRKGQSALARRSLVAPLSRIWPYQVKGENLLETIHPGQKVDHFTILKEFKKTGEFGRAFLAEIVEGEGAGQLRVLKFNVPNAKHGCNYLERTAYEFQDYVRLKRGGFTDLAIYYDFEPFVNDREVDRILSLKRNLQNQAFQQFLEPKLTSGYHVVEYVEDAAEVPIQMERDGVSGRLSRVYKMDVPSPADPDYGFWDKVRQNLRRLCEAEISSDYSIYNIGRSGKYFDLRPNETDESPFVEIAAVLKTYTLEGSDLYRWLDPRVP